MQTPTRIVLALAALASVSLSGCMLPSPPEVPRADPSLTDHEVTYMVNMDDHPKAPEAVATYDLYLIEASKYLREGAVPADAFTYLATPEHAVAAAASAKTLLAEGYRAQGSMAVVASEPFLGNETTVVMRVCVDKTKLGLTLDGVAQDAGDFEAQAVTVSFEGAARVSKVTRMQPESQRICANTP